MPHAEAALKGYPVLLYYLYVILKMSSLKDAVTIFYDCSLDSQGGLTSGSTAGKDDVVDKKAYRDA